PVNPVHGSGGQWGVVDFNGSDPTEMGAEMEDGFDFTEFPGPGRFVGNDFYFIRSEGDKIRLTQAEAVVQETQFLPVETHERGSNAIDGNGMGARKDQSAGFWIRRQRAVAFGADDPVHDCEIAQRFFSRLS